MTYTETPVAVPARRPRFWLPPARPIELPDTAAGNTVQLIGGAGLLVSWALEETTGAAVARCVIGDGSAQGIARRIAPVRLAANESTRDLIPGKGVQFLTGLAVTVTAGTVGGVLHVVLVTPAELDRIEAALAGFES